MAQDLLVYALLETALSMLTLSPCLVSLSMVDLSHNRVDDPAIVEVFEQMKSLVSNGLLS